MPHKQPPTLATPQSKSDWFELIGAYRHQHRAVIQVVGELRATITALRNDPAMTSREKRRLAEADQRWADVERQIERG